MHCGCRLRHGASWPSCRLPRLARDSAGRVTDIAIDHSEFEHLPHETIEQVVALMREAGMNATVSSIHINGWYGEHDKLSGARWIVRRLLGRELDAEAARWVYVGDSTNDQGMFGHFPQSVGVANLRRFAEQCRSGRRTWPSASAVQALPRSLEPCSRRGDPDAARG